MGSSTTQGSVYKHRQKLRIEEKVFCPHSCTAMVGSYIISTKGALYIAPHGDFRSNPSRPLIALRCYIRLRRVLCEAF